MRCRRAADPCPAVVAQGGYKGKGWGSGAGIVSWSASAKEHVQPACAQAAFQLPTSAAPVQPLPFKPRNLRRCPLSTWEHHPQLRQGDVAEGDPAGKHEGGDVGVGAARLARQRNAGHAAALQN